MRHWKVVGWDGMQKIYEQSFPLSAFTENQIKVFLQRLVCRDLTPDEIAELNLDADQVRTYDSDELWSYEIGFKSKLANNRVSINAAAFYIDWSDTLQNILMLVLSACVLQERFRLS